MKAAEQRWQNGKLALHKSRSMITLIPVSPISLGYQSALSGSLNAFNVIIEVIWPNVRKWYPAGCSQCLELLKRFVAFVAEVDGPAEGGAKGVPDRTVFRVATRAGSRFIKCDG